MKIRIRGNSVRFRLTKTEIANLGKDGLVEERCQLPGNIFVYGIQSTDGNELSASFKENKIELLMPKGMIDEFVNTERVGFKGSAGNVSLLIEKDFVCLDEVEEDQSDNYPNPRAM